jgi:hypothetical protein
MPAVLSDEQLLDISLAYSSEEILEILDIQTLELADLLKERILENILEFNLRPVDCNAYDL